MERIGSDKWGGVERGCSWVKNIVRAGKGVRSRDNT